MEYQALYRKWRPETFDDVKGQDKVVTALKNQLTNHRVGHAYLFCGTRGTGKTTIAKLLAKAVNCANPGSDGSPCGKCASCQAIKKGNSFNVREIDAASNNGVDNIRDIKEDVQYAPPEGKYKVYIIDEVHMLSTGAFNALLKTLEEPPEHAMFILATTEAHKIPITILSRCQRYDFERIDIQTITDRLQNILNREGIEADPAAVRYVAKVADGSMRDGLSLLERCTSVYMNQPLTYNRVMDVLGTVDIDVFNQLMEHIANNDAQRALDVINDVVWKGSDLTQFTKDFTWYMRNMMIIKTSDGYNDQVDLTRENYEVIKSLGEKIELNELMRDIRIFSEMPNQMRNSSQKRITLELGVIKSTTPQMERDVDALIERVQQLEDQLAAVSVDDRIAAKEQRLESRQQSEIAKEDSQKIIPESNFEPAAEISQDKMNTSAKPIDNQDYMNISYDEVPDALRILSSMQSYGQSVDAAGVWDSIHAQLGEDRRSIHFSFDDNAAGQEAQNWFVSNDIGSVLKDNVLVQTGKELNVTCGLPLQEDLHINLGPRTINRMATDNTEDISLMVQDDSPYVRCAVAQMGQHLSELCNDESPMVRAEVAKHKFSLHTLMKDESPLVRGKVASVRYGLDKLKDDPDPYVRLKVAEQGYAPEQFINDADEQVRLEASRHLEKSIESPHIFHEIER